ncbi:MMPL family transporter [Herbiconiux ginsengi]|uniref:Putative drug exporter of the RND superfamily n=1 Tax=Herbiconiux ginsengi TaxID=381665 RepID=A0A1H3MB49_9MICO|nr:MMPL family transporter [Herbiconiux ginsengi]SDY73816.1 putative drug exporter of the RND superfamily [Herbiconiux ginsengi]
MATLLYRIGRFAARRSIAVIVGWIVVLGLAITGAGALGGVMTSSFAIPGTESQQAIDMLDQRFPAASGGSAKVIYAAPAGKTVDDFESQIAASVAALTPLDHVSGVTGPFSADATAQINDDRTMAYATVQYDVPTTQLTEAQNEAVVAAGDTAASDGLSVYFSGVTDPPEAAVDYTEAIGLVVAFIVLLITFGSLLAAGMPLITSVIGVAVTSTLITIVSGFVTISSTAPLLATMLGLAVGIDYALFIVARHRTQLIHGMDPKESAATAVATAGSAVVFAGLTVIIALLGLSVVQIPFLTVMGIGAAVSVVIAVLVALTLLPAVLGLFGRKLIPKPTSRAARRELASADPSSKRRTLGARWVALATAKPVITVVVVVIGLVVVALPATTLRLTLPDAGYNPQGSMSREGYEQLTAGFGPGFNGPLLVTADISKITDLQPALTALHDQFAGLDDVASVSTAIPNPTLDMAIVSIIPSSAPDSVQTENLVHTMRDAAPAFDAENGFTYQVTGQTALGIDVSARLSDALLPFAVVVVGLCIILLTIVFRSLAVPISATIGYLLSVAASFGIVTAVFEWGWLADVFGVAKVGPVISFFPILLMAVLFGLAMDYQVFLVSRMREEFVNTGDPHYAVKHGFIGAARVVTAAACIMFAVFASFVPGGNAVLQPIALGLAAGVFIDAFLVRMTFIPAVMTLLGRLGWAIPRRLERALPNVDLEGEGVREMLDAVAWRPLAGWSDASGADAADRAVAGVSVGSEARPYAVAAELAVVEGAVAAPRVAPFSARAEVGSLLLVTGAADTNPAAVVAAIAGRQRLLEGHLRVLDQPLPVHAAALRRHSVLVARPVEADLLADRLPLGKLPPGALSVQERLQRELGDELAELWGAELAAEWMRQLAIATATAGIVAGRGSRAHPRVRLIALDGTGIPTAYLQHALGVIDAALPLETTLVVAHHGARLEAGTRPVRVIALAAVVPEPPTPPSPPVPPVAGAEEPDQSGRSDSPDHPNDPNPREEVTA